MKKFELHLHTYPASCCARQTAKEAVKKYHDLGIDGIVLTNHYSDAYIDRNGVTHEEHIRVLVDAFKEFKSECEKVGMTAILGMEVTLFAPYSKKIRETYPKEVIDKYFADYLIYGVTEEMLTSAPRLCDLTQEQLFDWCNQVNAVLIQAHPFRVCQGVTLQDESKMHGMEINTNDYHIDHDDTKEEVILEYCKKNGGITFASNDNHELWQTVNSVTYLPDDITDSVALARYMKEKKVLDYDLNFNGRVDDKYPRPV